MIPEKRSSAPRAGKAGTTNETRWDQFLGGGPAMRREKSDTWISRPSGTAEETDATNTKIAALKWEATEQMWQASAALPPSSPTSFGAAEATLCPKSKLFTRKSFAIWSTLATASDRTQSIRTKRALRRNMSASQVGAKVATRHICRNVLCYTITQSIVRRCASDRSCNRRLSPADDTILCWRC